jgi:hypothetical protein
VKGWSDQSAVGNGRPFLPGDLKFKDLNFDGFINQGSNTVAWSRRQFLPETRHF